jgi:nucleoside-diphosphate-sugar epimerase
LCDTGRQFDWVSVPGFIYDIRRRIPDTTKAKDLLGFETQIDLDQGLVEVISWLQTVLATEKAAVSDRAGGAG